MSKERFLAFNDAIIAIIATIMVLSFKTPTSTGFSALGQLAVPFFAYAASFLQIMMVWYNHHQLFRDIQAISIRAYLYNTLWLFVMSLFPFVTGWVGEKVWDRAAEYTFMVVLLVWMLFFSLMDYELTRTNPGIDKVLLSHSLSLAIRYGIPLVALLVIWFFPPAGLIANLLLVTLVYWLFFRQSVY